jgi:hypothetical protein
MVVRHKLPARGREAHQFLMHCLMDQIETGVAAAALNEGWRTPIPYPRACSA